VSELAVVQPPNTFSLFAGDPTRELAAPLDMDDLYADEGTTLKRTLSARFGSGGRPGIASLCTGDQSVDRLTLELLTPNDAGGIDYVMKPLPDSPNGVPTYPGYKFASYPVMASVDVDQDGVDEILIVGNVRQAQPGDKVIGVPG